MPQNKLHSLLLLSLLTGLQTFGGTLTPENIATIACLCCPQSVSLQNQQNWEKLKEEFKSNYPRYYCLAQKTTNQTSLSLILNYSLKPQKIIEDSFDVFSCNLLHLPVFYFLTNIEDDSCSFQNTVKFLQHYQAELTDWLNLAQSSTDYLLLKTFLEDLQDELKNHNENYWSDEDYFSEEEEKSPMEDSPLLHATSPSVKFDTKKRKISSPRTYIPKNPGIGSLIGSPKTGTKKLLFLTEEE